MATEMARWALVGMILAVIVFSIAIGWLYFSAPRYSQEEKEQINNAYAANCSKCLEKENVSCKPDKLKYSPWGAICDDKYVPRNCTQCKQIS